MVETRRKRKSAGINDNNHRITKMKYDVVEDAEEGVIEHDDLCHICAALLYRPVITRCGHSFCELCMAHWADVSISTQMTTLGLDIDTTIVLPPHEIETKCPMCRTLTIAHLDDLRAADLRRNYRSAYVQRALETDTSEASEDFIEAMTLYIGNEHKNIRLDDDESRNKHEWKFFVRPSRTDIIEEVQIFLHPTFRNPKIVVQWAPYEIRRQGWGVFTVFVNLILKAGYSWVSVNAEDTIDGGKNGKLPLEWQLDFTSNGGRGSQGRCRLKVRKEKEGQEIEDERQTQRVRRAWLRQRETDPDYQPPPSPSFEVIPS